MLPVNDARWLFDRATSLRPERDVITYEYIGPPWLGAGKELTWYNEALLKVKWEAEDAASGDSHPIAHQRRSKSQKHNLCHPHLSAFTDPLTYIVIEDVKRKAERDRDADLRLIWAKRAVDVAVLSMSVGLLKDIANWSRRFIRDPVCLISSSCGPRDRTPVDAGAE